MVAYREGGLQLPIFVRQRTGKTVRGTNHSVAFYREDKQSLVACLTALSILTCLVIS